MTLIAERTIEHIGESCGMADHDRDLVHELDKRLDCLWRCDQYMANARGHKDVVNFWMDIKDQEQRNVDRLRSLIKSEITHECF